jgi:hypothetical protein
MPAPGAYTDPEVEGAGLTENEARVGGVEYEMAMFPWAASGRALSLARSEGLTKLLYGRVRASQPAVKDATHVDGAHGRVRASQPAAKDATHVDGAHGRVRASQPAPKDATHVDRTVGMIHGDVVRAAVPGARSTAMASARAGTSASGGLAASVRAEPRFTRDVEVAVAATRKPWRSSARCERVVFGSRRSSSSRPRAGSRPPG